MQGQLLVTPEVLESTASEFSEVSTQVMSLTDQMLTKVTDLNSSWQGEASDAYIKKFTELRDDIERVNGMIKEHVSDLTEMANIYKTAEQENVEIANALAGDIIS